MSDSEASEETKPWGPWEAFFKTFWFAVSSQYENIRPQDNAFRWQMFGRCSLRLLRHILNTPNKMVRTMSKSMSRDTVSKWLKARIRWFKEFGEGMNDTYSLVEQRKQQALSEVSQKAAQRKQSALDLTNTLPVTFDPEAAVQDMRMAHSYLQDWENSKGNSQTVLGHAARYIRLAAAKDPNAKLTVEEKGEPFTYTIDDLSGIALFYEGQGYVYEGAKAEQLERAREVFEKAIAYRPFSVQIRSHLADVFLNLYDKESALRVAQEAVAAMPRNIDARKLLDRIEAAPERSPPTMMETNPGMVWVLVGCGCLVFSVFLLFAGSFGAAGFTFLIAIGLFVFASMSDKKVIYEKAAQHVRDESERQRQK
jgi:tetratricopeptide (TPR) repeat protein